MMVTLGNTDGGAGGTNRSNAHALLAAVLAGEDSGHGRVGSVGFRGDGRVVSTGDEEVNDW
jgi:hypothetical protein